MATREPQFREVSRNELGDHRDTMIWRGKPVGLLALPASTNFFSMLGAKAQIGRTFRHADLNNPCTLVLAYPFWQQKLGAPKDIAGQTLTVGPLPLCCGRRDAETIHLLSQRSKCMVPDYTHKRIRAKALGFDDRSLWIIETRRDPRSSGSGTRRHAKASLARSSRIAVRAHLRYADCAEPAG